MRIVVYNILEGGEGRADPLAEVIESRRPDVVALVEADVESVVERIAKRLGMDFIIAPGKKHGSALLSRWSMVETINHSLLSDGISRSFLEARVQTPSGMILPIGVLHLPAGAYEVDEDARIKDLAVILDLFKQHRVANRAHVLCGDFNSNSPQQRIDIARCKMKTQEAFAANGGKLPRRVVEAMIGTGYLDTYSVLHDETQEMIGSFDTQLSGQRVDYCFTFGFGRSKIHDAWVERDRLAKYASDHYPIGAEIDLG